LNVEGEKGAGRESEFQGRSDATMRLSYDMEGSDMGKDNCELSLERINIEENLSYDEKCRLLEMLHKYWICYINTKNT
jgi:hypothetical protein